MAPRETGYHMRPPTDPQPTLSKQTSDLQTAVDLAIAKAGQNFHLQVQRALSLQQSQSMEWANRATRWWKAAAGIGIAASLTMGTMMATCMNAYQSARVDAIEPATRAEQSATDATSRVDEHADRLASIEENQNKLGAAVEKLNGAVLALMTKMDPDPHLITVPAAAARPRRGSR